jgi:hypothetical protein
LDYWKDGNSSTSYLKKVGRGVRGEEVSEEGGGGGMGEDEEVDCKTWQNS